MTKWPQHKNPSAEHAAKAPYNFVSLPEQVVTVEPEELPDQDRYYADRYTGRLECELTTASPLYVRAALEPEEFKQSQKPDEGKKLWREQVRNKPDFFYTDPAQRRPVIPGSSLRGMLRTLVEIAGYGKVENVAARKLVYRSVGDTTSHGEGYRERLMRFDGEGVNEQGKRCHLYTPLMQAGYMIRQPNGDWAIQPAKNIGGTTFARIAERKIPGNLTPWAPGCKNASQIWVTLGKYDYQQVRGGFIKNKYTKVLEAASQPQKGMVSAALARSGWIPNKRSEVVVFEEDKNAPLILIDDDLVRAYRDQVTEIYTEQAKQGQTKTQLLGQEGVLVDRQPVFYLIENGQLVFFGHCMMFRLPYKHSPLDFVPPTLRREVDTDLAEAIFGYTKGQEKRAQWEKLPPKVRAYAGRVFISDAVAQGDPANWWLADAPVVPRILGGPKPTTFQHYLVQQQPNPIPTSGRFQDGRPRTRLELSDYAAKKRDETVIRGHKLYWHKGGVGLSEIQEPKAVSERDTQHTQIKPVRDGATFTFQIQFENLSAIELGALLWVLDRARNEAYRLNLGMGKPYGMGAVRVAATLHLQDRKARYASLFASDDWGSGEQPMTEVWQRSVAAFERYVLDGIGESGPKRLDEIARIQQLLAMLRWPGPNSAQTRYLEIEYEDPQAGGRKTNEYKNRPVLPGPTWEGLAGRPVSTLAPGVQSENGEKSAPGYIHGTVKEFGLGPNRSFGFITVIEREFRLKYGDQPVFVHQSHLAPGVTTLKEGQSVMFRLIDGMKGPEAHDVRLV